MARCPPATRVAADLVEVFITPTFTAGSEPVSLGGLTFTRTPATP